MKLKAIAGSIALVCAIVGSLLLLCRQTAHETIARQQSWIRGTSETGRAIASEPATDEGASHHEAKVPDGYVPR